MGASHSYIGSFALSTKSSWRQIPYQTYMKCRPPARLPQEAALTCGLETMEIRGLRSRLPLPGIMRLAHILIESYQSRAKASNSYSSGQQIRAAHVRNSKGRQAGNHIRGIRWKEFKKWCGTKSLICERHHIRKTVCVACSEPSGFPYKMGNIDVQLSFQEAPIQNHHP